MSGGMDDENEYQRAIFEAIADEIIQQSTRGGKFGTAAYQIKKKIQDEEFEARNTRLRK